MTTVVRAESAARLASVGRGFGRPVHAAQQTFRALLEAMSRPGRLQTLPDTVIADIEPPGLPRGLTALLLTLLDAETTLWADHALVGEAGLDYLRFHTGVRTPSDERDAAFVVWPARHATPAAWSVLDAGTDEVPQAGATLLVDVPVLRSQPEASGGTLLQLRGPGIETVQPLVVGGLDAAFWQTRAALEGAYPRGIDVILCCGDTFAAIPRTTRITVEG